MNTNDSRSERSFRSLGSSWVSGLDAPVTASLAVRYMSPDRRFLLWLKRLESVMFGSVYAMVQENPFRQRIQMFGAIVDFLRTYFVWLDDALHGLTTQLSKFSELFSFTLSQDFGWGIDFGNVASMLLGPVQLMSWNTFIGFFWAALVIVLSAFVVGYYVGFNVLISDYSMVFSMKYMRTVVNLLLGVLFIPVVAIFCVPLKVGPDGLLRNFVVAAWGPETTLYGVLAIIMLIIFIPSCLVFGLVNFEYSSHSGDSMSRHTGWLDFNYIIIKTVVTLVANLSPPNISSSIARVIVLLLATLGLLFIMFVYVPYYKYMLNVFRATLFGGLFGAAVSTCIKIFSGQIYTRLGIEDVAVLFVHIGFTIGFGIIALLLMRTRLARLLDKQKLYVYLTQKRSLNAEGAVQDVALNEIKRRTSQCSSAQMLSPIRRPKRVADIQMGFIKSLFVMFVNSIHAANVVARNMFLQMEGIAEDQEAGHMADSLFQRGIDSRPNSPLIVLHYANFLICRNRDWIRATAQLRRANSMKLGFFHRWLSFVIAKRIDREKRVDRTGLGGGNLMKYIDYHRMMDKANTQYYLSLHYLEQFWRCLVYDDGAMMQKKLSKLHQKCSAAQVKALRVFSRLISGFRNSHALWRSYGSFLQDVCFENDMAQEAFQTANDLEDNRAKKPVKPTRPTVRPGSGAGAGVFSMMETIPENELDGAPITPLESPNKESMGHDARSVGTKSHKSQDTSTSTAASINKLIQLQSKDTISSLGFRFDMSLFALFLLVFTAWLVSLLLLQSTEFAFSQSTGLMKCQTELAVGTLTLQDLLMDIYLNDTLGLNQASWSFIHEGRNTKIETAQAHFGYVSTHIDQIYGVSRNYKKGVDVTWDTTKVFLQKFSPPSVVELDAKNAIETVVREADYILKLAQAGALTRDNVFKMPAVPLVIVNFMQGMDSVWKKLANSYEQASFLGSNTIVVVLYSLFGATLMVVGVLLVVFLLPSVSAVHFDQHLIHSLLTLIPINDIEKVADSLEEAKTQRLERLMDTDDAAQMLLEKKVSYGGQKKRKVKSVTGSVEGHLYRTTRSHVKQCKELRPIIYIFLLSAAVGLPIVWLFLSANIYQATDDLMVTKLIDYASCRMDNVVKALGAMNWLPSEMSSIFNNQWGQNVVANSKQFLTEMLKCHKYGTYGNTEDGTSNAFSYNMIHQPAAVAQMNSGMRQVEQAMDLLLSANATTLTFANPLYAGMQKLWQQPRGTSGVEKAMEQYSGFVAKTHESLLTANMAYLIGLTLYLIVVSHYLVVKSTIVRILLDRQTSGERLLKMLPSDVQNRVPAIADYLKDRSQFLEHLKEEGKNRDTSVEGLDDAWAKTYFEKSRIPYTILNSTFVIVYHNRVAKDIFKFSKNMKELVIESLVIPSYRTALSSALHMSKRNIGKTTDVKVIIEDGRIFTVSLSCVSLDSSLRSSSIIYVLSWNELSETTVGSYNTRPESVLLASNVIWESVPLLVLSLSGNVVSGNSSALKLLKMDSVDSITTFASLFGSSYEECASNLLLEALTTPEHSATDRFVLKQRSESEEDRTVTVRVSVSCAATSAVNDVRYVIAVLEDLSDLYAIQTGLDQHRSLLRTIFDCVPIGIVVIGPKRSILMISEAAVDVFGYSRKAMIGQNVSILFSDDTDVDAVVDSVAWRKEIVKRQNDTASPIFVSCNIVKNVDRKILLFVDVEKINLQLNDGTNDQSLLE